ncbi:MAG: hypothetical protein GXX11_09735 [Acholeplasmataceae bacterium]|nr:hypothetical protein [Acholeplasmataceae bacterium]
MTQEENLIINLENASLEAIQATNPDVVNSVFNQYGATGICDLSPIYYEEVFYTLEQIANDN